MKQLTRIAILGGGPSGLFMYKRLIESNRQDFAIDIFEKKKQLGSGMPYSVDGACDEHITNVSDNEIPKLVTGIGEWLKTVSVQTQERYRIDPENFNEYKVLPRLLFGEYLSAQFELLHQQALDKGILTTIHLDKTITDIIDHPDSGTVSVETDGNVKQEFDHVVICTGHRWPAKHEGTVPGFYDSPYPPLKLAKVCNHPVAIKGCSLTAIDAIRTLARHNGTFEKTDEGIKTFVKAQESPDFRIVMHSRNGMLPALRFHLEDSHLLKDSILSDEEIAGNRKANDGFLELDYVFERNFKDGFKNSHPRFYERIKDLSLEDFVAKAMEIREGTDPFKLFKEEYAEAERSIEQEKSVYWKEMLAVLSFAMNYPAKYFSAEDHLRLKKTLMPLISIVIAFVPQSSAEDLMALHQVGVLDLIATGDSGDVEPNATGGAFYKYILAGKEVEKHYQTYVDCTGQPHLSFEDLPYHSLRSRGTIAPARYKFKDISKGINELKNGNACVEKGLDGSYFLRVPGIKINDCFQVISPNDKANDRIFMMAVPYIGGYNPDYSGLDFCEEASARILKALVETAILSTPVK